MATKAATQNISGLARAMVQHGLLSEYDAETLQGQAQTANIGFVEQMLLSKRMNAAQVAVFASRAFGALHAAATALSDDGASTYAEGGLPRDAISAAFRTR